MLNHKIKKYAYFLELFCKVVVVPVSACSFVYGWFIRDSSLDNLFAGFGYSWDEMKSLTSIPTISKILGMTVDGLSYLLLFIGVFYFIKLLKSFQHGTAFSSKTLQILQSICKIALVWTVYTPIKRTLLTVVTTFFNPVGQRMINVTISSTDVINIFIFASLMIITSLVNEACVLKSDQDLTI